MRNKFIGALAVIAMLFGSAFVMTNSASATPKVTLCHNGNTISVGWQAAFGHNGHLKWPDQPGVGHENDYLGECVVVDTTTTTEAPVTTTTEVPVTTTTEAPVTTTTEKPVVTTTEKPVVTTTEKPVVPTTAKPPADDPDVVIIDARTLTLEISEAAEADAVVAEPSFTG